MEKLIDIDIRRYPVAPVLEILLKDKTTKKNIIWATDSYAEYGKGFQEQDELLPGLLLKHPEVIAPRILKSQEKQAARTRQKAEVFTPAWLCNQMNNFCDQEYFGRGNVFNIETPNHTWVAVEQRIEFPAKTDWKHYVDSRRLEITCGEAPYLVSRYDVATGETIPIPRRIGMLDRKLRVVNENTDSAVEWQNWAIRALESCYGYEFQGDSLLIARINLLCTMVDYYEARFGRRPEDKLLRHLAHKIAWNIWQMDGLTRMVPLGKSNSDVEQPTFHDRLGQPIKVESSLIPCRIFNWRSKFSLEYKKLFPGREDLCQDDYLIL